MRCNGSGADQAGLDSGGYSYDVFGAPRTTTGTTANDFRYTAQQRDGNANRGLYFLRARSYDPALGRFLQKDPLPLINRYSYVGNNPGNLTDPNGLCSGPWCSVLPSSSIPAISDWTRDALNGLKAATIDPFVDGGRNTGRLLANSYYDFNVTAGCGGNVFTAGLQFDRSGGYGYGGGGRGSCGVNVSLSIAPHQQVTHGINCGAAGDYTAAVGDLPVGGMGQVGRGGITPRNLGTAFKEAGITLGTSGWSITCAYIHKYWSW